MSLILFQKDWKISYNLKIAFIARQHVTLVTAGRWALNSFQDVDPADQFQIIKDKCNLWTIIVQHKQIVSVPNDILQSKALKLLIAGIKRETHFTRQRDLKASYMRTQPKRLMSQICDGGWRNQEKNRVSAYLGWRGFQLLLVQTATLLLTQRWTNEDLKG